MKERFYFLDMFRRFCSHKRFKSIFNPIKFSANLMNLIILPFQLCHNKLTFLSIILSFSRIVSMSFSSFLFFPQNWSDLSSSSLRGPFISGIVLIILASILTAVSGFWLNSVTLVNSSSFTISYWLCSLFCLALSSLYWAYSIIFLFLADTRFFLLPRRKMISFTMII